MYLHFLILMLSTTVFFRLFICHKKCIMEIKILNIVFFFVKLYKYAYAIAPKFTALTSTNKPPTATAMAQN